MHFLIYILLCLSLIACQKDPEMSSQSSCSSVLTENQEGVCRGVLAICELNNDGDASFKDDFSSVDAFENEEVSCDGLDNDCDGVADEGCQQINEQENMNAGGTMNEQENMSGGATMNEQENVNRGGNMNEQENMNEGGGMNEQETDSASGGAEMTGGDVYIEVPDMGGEMFPTDLGEDGQGAHAFVMRNIEGDMVDLRVYRGKVLLIVNVASRCGYTRQYEGLQSLYEEYRDRGFEILGFPANNFGGQEPGTEEEIQEFCSSNYGVTFPMFTKISVKGNDIHPLYSYLTEASGREVSWNFNKFLVNIDGLFENHFLSATTPESVELRSAIDALLPTP